MEGVTRSASRLLRGWGQRQGQIVDLRYFGGLLEPVAAAICRRAMNWSRWSIASCGVEPGRICAVSGPTTRCNRRPWSTRRMCA
jgi:hypothetical protein